MIIILLSLIIFYFLLFHKYNTYLGLSLLFICFAPPIQIGGLTFNYGAYLVMLGGYFHFSYLIFRRKKNNVNNKIRAYNIIIISLMLVGFLITIFSLGNAVKVNAAIVGVLFVLSVNYYVWLIDNEEEVDIYKVIKFFFIGAVILNVIVVLGQLILPKVFTQLIIDIYYADFRNRGENALNWYGYFNRATGLTYTPVLLGGLSLILFFLGLFVRVKWKSIFLIAVIFMGLMAFSKTFFLGLIFGGVFFIRHTIKLFSKGFLGVLFLISIIAVGSLFSSFDFGGNLSNRILNFLSVENTLNSAIESRYEPQNDILFSTTFSKIDERPILGWGYITDEKVFLGDSSYVVLLYKNGIMGLFLFLILLIILYFNSGPLPRVILILLSLIGFGTSAIDNIFYLPIWIIALSHKANLVLWTVRSKPESKRICNINEKSV